jgi:hypothetical protein
MTRLTDALACLADIHAHLAKGEVYQGLQAKPVVLSGCAGCLAAAGQHYLILPGDAVTFVWYWLAVAFMSGLVGCSGALAAYWWEDDPLSRRRARIVAGQFLPFIAAGILTPIAFLPYLRECVGLLPGLWAIFYGLGLFAARPYLPRATGWVGLYYLVAGVLLLNLLPLNRLPSGWSIGLPFFLGQLGLAAVLYRNQRRECADA